MHVLDASSIIHAWDNYPIEQFPGLWGWLKVETQSHQLAIPTVALEEVGHKYPECAQWLIDKAIKRLPMERDVVLAALHIKQLVGIAGDKYNPKWVDENDIFIIATAQFYGGVLITNESRQFGKQSDSTKRKIPAACQMRGINVVQLNFIEYIQQSEQVF